MQLQAIQQLAIWHEAIKDVAASDPCLASGAEKALQGIREMQKALVTSPQPPANSFRLIPHLELHIPMPEGAAVPLAAEQSPSSHQE
jgi:hypothetical protein